MITVTQKGSHHELRSMGQPCGPRLIKGDGFPLKLRGRDTFRFESAREAEEAAAKLRDYLKKHEKRK